MAFSPRRLFFERLISCLALMLGLAQVLLVHWLDRVTGGSGLGGVSAAGLTLLLVGANVLVVPTIRTRRRRDDWTGSATRIYTGLGIGTLLLGVVIALLWSVFLALSGLLGVAGVGGSELFPAFRISSVGAVGFIVLSLIWGYSIGQARVKPSHQKLPLPGLDPALVGLRVVQISDLHIGNRLEGVRLDKMVEQTNGFDPDVVVITGDIFDFDPAFIDDGARSLAGLKARVGVYAVLGNHDVYTGAQRVVDGLARYAPEIRVLRDELVALPVSAPLYLAGVEDTGRDWSARSIELDALPRLAGERPLDGPTLLLVHRPEVFDQAAQLGFPWVLAGHTHGGQLALPTPGGHYNLARFTTRYTRGLFEENGSGLYVNRGLGMGGPALRINCPREIAVLELSAAPSGPDAR